MQIEITGKRSANGKHFDNGDGTFTYNAHVGHIHYFNKLGAGDGQVRWREIDNTLSWDDTKKGWAFLFHSFRPFIPEYADDWLVFRDLFDGKDQEVKYKAVCNHVKGRLVNPSDVGMERYSQQQLVIYDDAFGLGQDYVVYFTRSSMVKAVRIRDGMKPATDTKYRWQFDNGGEEFFRGSKEDRKAYKLDKKRSKVFDTEKPVRIGTDKQDGKEWQTYLRPFFVWDNKKKQVTPTEYIVDGADAFLEKTVTKAFLDSSVGDVLTDTTTSYYAGAGDGRVGNSGTVWSTVRGASTGDDSQDSESYRDNFFQTYKSGSTYLIQRDYYPVDTSGIGSGKQVDSATFNFYLQKAQDANSSGLTLVPTSQASTSSLATTDFGSVGSTSFGSGTFAGWTNNAMNSITLNSSGLAAINMTGATKIGVRYTLDFSDTAPTGLNYNATNFSEYTGTSADPYYSITYSDAPANAETKLNRSPIRGVMRGVCRP